MPADLRHLAADAARASCCARAARGCCARSSPRLLDDLLLTVAPLLVAGDAPTSLTGPPLDPPAPLAPARVHRAGDHLFLHYAAAA